MDQKLLTLVQALGMEKAAACDAGRKPPSYVRGKAKKKAVIEKISVDASSTPSAVDVIRIDATKAAELCAALQKLSAAQDAEDTSDEGNEVEPGTEYLASASDEKPKKAPKKRPEAASENEIEYTKQAAGALSEFVRQPWVVRLLQGLRTAGHTAGKSAVVPGAIGASVGALGGAFNPREDESRLINALRGAISAGGIGALGGAGAGLGGLPTSQMYRDSIGKTIMKSTGQGLGAGAGVGLGLGALHPMLPHYEHEGRLADWLKEQERAEKRPKKSPKKKPAEEKSKKAPKKPVEKESSFGAFLKQAFGMGQPAKPLESESLDTPLREGMKSGTRQDMFNVLSKWSLGRG